MANVFIAKHINDFKHAFVNNPRYKEMPISKNKKITNTSCIVVWFHPIEEQFYYLIQKRSSIMTSGASKLAVGGGYIEKRDKYLQYGAIREILEESQMMLKKDYKSTMTSKTIEQASKNLFYLSEDTANVTFYFIIVSKKEPKWRGPIKKNQYPFKKSTHELDTYDDKWANKKLKNRIHDGHCFMTKAEIIDHIKNNKKIKFWKYSKDVLYELFRILEK